jgi:glycosyltransferase involved in cell wall biosynthesis
MRTLSERYSTRRIACTRQAGCYLFGSGWGSADGDEVLYCGIELAPFRAVADSAKLRRDLNLPDAAVVLGHVGRFFPPKNHSFLIRVAAELMKSDPAIHLLLLGEGPLRPQIENLSQALGLQGRVHFPGNRADVPIILRHLVDVMVFPSLNEGLPLALLEAQAAGVPSVVAATVTKDVVVIPELMQFLDLEAPLSDWTQAIRLMLTRRSFDRQVSLRVFEKSAFSLQQSTSLLKDIYLGR